MLPGCNASPYRGWYGALLPPIAGSCIAGLTFSCSVCCFSLSTSLPVALFFVALAGGGMMAQIAAKNTYVQTHVEDHMRSRVISYYVMAFQGMLPIGNLLTGTIVHQLGAKHTVTMQSIAGAVCVALFTYYSRSVRQDTPHRSAEAIP
ncbi:MFS transporter [Chitinophaga sp. LS1]|uniref:MFS transporter n=1 Tax=Chitinophaga sp. LS1 TaxID=3051176 RepID=UPI002AABDB6A|nr:MFS transporter [Chitinophaga sp. LS1]WPV64774.1 MFS transporter [Chitinophaga sp. LS1]